MACPWRAFLSNQRLAGLFLNASLRVRVMRIFVREDRAEKGLLLLIVDGHDVFSAQSLAVGAVCVW